MAAEDIKTAKESKLENIRTRFQFCVICVYVIHVYVIMSCPMYFPLPTHSCPLAMDMSNKV